MSYPHLQAFDRYLEQVRQFPDVVGVILTGSVIHSQAAPNSDVDVMVILRPGCDYRERGNTWVDGIEIEYFQNPPEQIRAYFRQEVRRPVTAHMFAGGIVKHDSHPVVAELVAEAQAIMARKPAAWGAVPTEFGRYEVDDLWKDYLDVMGKSDLATAKLIGAALIEHCVRCWFGKHQHYTAKRKRLLQTLRPLDPAFAQTVAQALMENGAEELAAMQQLVEATETFLGGKRPAEWVMRGPLQL